MTLEDIVKLSGIADYPNYLTHDYAVPIGIGGKYPHGGKAISVYYKSGGMDIIPYQIIMKMAIETIKSQLTNPHIYMLSNQSKPYGLIQKYIYLTTELLDTMSDNYPVDGFLYNLNK